MLTRSRTPDMLILVLPIAASNQAQSRQCKASVPNRLVGFFYANIKAMNGLVRHIDAEAQAPRCSVRNNTIAAEQIKKLPSPYSFW